MIPRWARSIPIWVYAAIIVLGVIGWQHVEIGHYKAKTASLQSAALTYQSAQQSQLATIAKLEEANKQWAATDAADLALGKTYADAAQQYAMQQQAQKVVAQRKLTVIYAKFPSVKAWSVAAGTPTTVVDQLRANAGGPN